MTVAAPWRFCRTCSTQAQTESPICPWCGSRYNPPPPVGSPIYPPAAYPSAAPASSVMVFPRSVGTWAATIAVTLAILMTVGWLSGSLDPWLSNFGLNKEPCLENYLTGNVVCGDKAHDFCRRLAEPPDPIVPDACKDL